MIAGESQHEWFDRGLRLADRSRDSVGVVLCANLKGQTTPIEDYETDSIVTEFLSNSELDAFISGFEEAGIYCEVVLDEDGFIKWLNGGAFQFGRPQPLVYSVTQNGIGPARFSLVPALCRLYNIPVVDSDAYAVALGQHKFHLISLLEQFGLPVAHSWWFTKSGWWPNRPQNGLRVIAKPTLDSASVGVHYDSVFCVDANIENRLRSLMEQYRQPMTIQEFIPGFEVEVPVLEAEEPHAWMAVGIQLGSSRAMGDSILTYDEVYGDRYTFYDFAEESSELADQLLRIARKVHNGLGFAGPSRIDYRVSLEGQAHVMEVTCKPHLTQHTSFAHAIKSAGYSYSDLLKFLFGSAVGRINSSSRRPKLNIAQ